MVDGLFFGELIRVDAEPNDLAVVGFAHWNGPATQLDNEHRPFIPVQAAQLRDLVIGELTGREGIASDGSSGER
jgi:hypothetical protein